MDMKIRKYSALFILLLSLPFLAVAKDEQTWKVNLKDANIKAFISQAANITGHSFVIDLGRKAR